MNSVHPNTGQQVLKILCQFVFVDTQHIILKWNHSVGLFIRNGTTLPFNVLIFLLLTGFTRHDGHHFYSDLEFIRRPRMKARKIPRGKDGPSKQHDI